MSRETVLAEVVRKWRDVFVDPTWVLEAVLVPGLPGHGRYYACWEMWYAKLEVNADIAEELIERVVVHELCELEMHELGRQFEEMVVELGDSERERELKRHGELRNRLIERRLRTLLPGGIELPGVKTKAGSVADTVAEKVKTAVLLALAGSHGTGCVCTTSS